MTGAGGEVRSAALYSWYMSGPGVSSPGFQAFLDVIPIGRPCSRSSERDVGRNREPATRAYWGLMAATTPVVMAGT